MSRIISILSFFALPLLSLWSTLFSIPTYAQYSGVDPNGFSTPTTNTTGTYFVSWNSAVYPVRVFETKQGVSGEVPINATASLQGNISVSRSNGVYTYKFMYCPSGATNCGLWGTSTTTVNIQSANSSSTSSISVPPVGVSPTPAPETSGLTTPIGSIAGSFRVNESGSATYTMQIITPPGVAGVTPKITINYDSQTNWGLVGYGANIGGLGAITRCRQTLLQDGATLPITWSANDRFCINGQKLMLISGSYGTAESVYKTEIDSYMQITAKGGSAGNPDYFEIETKDGATSIYGGSENSKINIVSSSILIPSGTMAWSLSRFQDSIGNRIDYDYEGDLTTGQRIKSINYAYAIPKTSQNPNAKINFLYEDRSDISVGHTPNGSVLKSTKRLKSIATYNITNNSEHLFRKYNFQYTYSNNGQSRLTNITECMDSSSITCYPATTFEWATANTGVSQTAESIQKFSSREIKNHKFMDINGDGKQDLVWVIGAGPYRYIGYSYTDSAVSEQLTAQPFTNMTYSLDYAYGGTTNQKANDKLIIDSIDFNSDGKQDLVACMESPNDSNLCVSWDLYLAEPTLRGKWILSGYKITLPFVEKHVRFGDINADGLIDAYVLTDGKVKYYSLEKTSSPATNKYYSFSSSAKEIPLLSKPNALGLSPQNNFTHYKKEMTLGDFNGDGIMDIAVPAYGTYDTNSWRIFIYIFKNGVFEYSHDLSFVDIESGTCYAIMGNCSIGPYPIDLKAVDLNQDGLSDLIYADQANDLYRINTGTKFSGRTIARSATQGTPLPLPNINLTDYNLDGFLDAVFHDTVKEKLVYRLWDQSTQTFKTEIQLSEARGKFNSYYYSDITGDGFSDLVEIKVGSDSSIDFRFYKANSNTRHNKVHTIKDGLDKITSIKYGSLAHSKNYTTIVGVNSSTTDANFCNDWQYTIPCVPPIIYAPSINSFYLQINQPFGTTFELENPAPTLELAGPIYVVTEVDESAPIASNPNNTNKVSYHYHHARIQAGGRGYLGFEKLTTIDIQTGVRTETTYYQDWPFTGSPKSTIVKTSAGHKLSEATNTMAVEQHATNSRIKRVYLDVSTEVSYALKDNGTTQGNSLQTITTDTDYDNEGNVTRVQTTTSGSANTSTKIVTNTFSTDAWEKRMGRLLSTTTTTQRNSDAVITRKSSFEYHGRYETWPGMLKKEIIEPGTNQQVVTYLYDDVGNKKETIKTAQVKPGVNQTRKTVIEYDTSKRFAKTTKDSLGNVTSGVVTYHPVYGLPTQVRDANGVITTIKYNDQGQEYQRVDATGAWTHTNRVYCGGDVTCPVGARYRVENLVSGGGKSIDYLDILGRSVRSTKILFDGRESHVDTEYDTLGRVKRQSTPYASGETAYWSVFEYDILGRVTQVTAPDGTITTTTYDGYKTIVIADVNGKALKREEERNSLGHLIKVTDNLGGTITYGYDALGNLTSATTVASGKTVKVQMCYDGLGRKFAMHDPDKGGFLGNSTATCNVVDDYINSPPSGILSGWWMYRYNDFGELIEQVDTKKQTTVMDYDALGRMITRTDKFANGSVDAHTRWFYDKYLGETVADPETQLKLTAVVTSYGSINENCSGSNYCQTYLYDTASRVTDTFTYLPNHNVGYINSVKYDSIGRVYETRDVLNGLVGTSGTKTLFNSYGYAGEVRDLASNDVLQKTIKVNGRGQVTEEWRNNGGAGIATYQYDDKTGAMKAQKASIAGGAFPIQDIAYDWDAVGNLKSRWNQSSNVGRTAKKNLQESFCYDGLNRLIKSYVGTLTGSCSLTAASQDVEYDGLGNITRKTGVGTYTYSGKGPHAVTSTTNDGTYTYDNNGNQLSGASRSITYSSYDQPTRITKGTTITEFSYGPDRARWQRIETKGSQRTLTQYLGSVERIDVEGSNIVEWKRYIAGAIYTVRTTAVQSGGSINYSVQRTDKSFAYNDHLGSLDVVVNHVGQVTHTSSFDAWGNRRNAENWTGAFSASSLALTNYTNPITLRGYTGHEMLDDTGLIHMNGRIFDPRLARFMQADPFIQAAANTQSYNRYSYTINNPLNATDPSGYFLDKLFNIGGRYLLRPLFRSLGYDFSQMLISFGSVFCGPFAPACAAAGAYELNRAFGASTNDAISSAAFAGMSAMAFHAAGSIGAGNPTTAFFASGFVGGIMAELQGGKFAHGFASAGFSAASGAKFGFSWEGLLSSTVIGGTITEMTGGKFSNGAATAAFSYAMTWAASKYGPGGTSKKEGGDTGGSAGIPAADEADTVAAIGHAKMLTASALETLAAVKAGDADALALYEEWFGTYSDKNYNKVLKTFQRISKMLAKGFPIEVTYVEGDFAHTNRGGTNNTVYLDKAYFTASHFGFDSKGGVILHELGHRAGALGLGTKSYAAGLTESRALALKNSWQAVRNHDSYEYFAEGSSLR